MANTARSWREFISGADAARFRPFDVPFVNVGSSQASCSSGLA
jgi:hypothetical protein